jgi:hypothetical protein
MEQEISDKLQGKSCHFAKLSDLIMLTGMYFHNWKNNYTEFTP